MCIPYTGVYGVVHLISGGNHSHLLGKGLYCQKKKIHRYTIVHHLSNMVPWVLNVIPKWRPL
jgi:hypothetical protein